MGIPDGVKDGGSDEGLLLGGTVNIEEGEAVGVAVGIADGFNDGDGDEGLLLGVAPIPEVLL